MMFITGRRPITQSCGSRLRRVDEICSWHTWAEVKDDVLDKVRFRHDGAFQRSILLMDLAA